ncbi:MAG: MFS transporter [Clostridiales bacterium]|nr:MFS transporter [Clostridiales bacterium]
MSNLNTRELSLIQTNNKKQLKDTKSVRVLIAICWLAYYSTYLGRLNYSASMNEIISTGFLTKAGAGMIGTGFFICYGFGQLISGFLGDRISSRWMTFTGVAGTALINLLMYFSQKPNTMLILWCINGLVQSLTWSPIIKILSVRLDREKCKDAIIVMSTTVAAGTLSAYIMTALVIKITGWRMVFFTSFTVISMIAILWLIGIGILEKKADQQEVEEEEMEIELIHNPRGELKDIRSAQVTEKLPIWKLAISVGLIPISLCVIIQGILKDGVTAWVPTFISEVFHLGSVTSILATTILPIINLAGVYAANYMNKKYFKNEVATSGACFTIVSLALLLLILFGRSHMIVSVLLLSLTTTGMIGVNTMFISLLPLYFSKVGKVSTITGTLNSMAYIGSSLSTYGIGVISQKYGWNLTIVVWLFLAFLGAGICLLMKNLWQSAIIYKLQDN